MLRKPPAATAIDATSPMNQPYDGPAEHAPPQPLSPPVVTRYSSAHATMTPPRIVKISQSCNGRAGIAVGANMRAAAYARTTKSAMKNSTPQLCKPLALNPKSPQ